jgi:hypothetical protein
MLELSVTEAAGVVGLGWWDLARGLSPCP